MSLWAASGLLAQQAGGVGVEIDPDKPPPVTAPLPAWATKPADRNAAIEYWALSSSIPRELSDLLGKVDWDAAGTSTDPNTFPPSLTEAIAALSKPGMNWTEGDAATEASKLRMCDFQTKLEYGVQALMPHLGQMRKLARVLRLEARVAMTQHDAAKATARVAALFRMANHTTNDRVLIGSLVGVAISAMAREEAQALLASGMLNTEQKAEVAAAVRALLNDDPFRLKEAVGMERDIFLAQIVGSLKAGPKGREYVAALMEPYGKDAERIKALDDSQIDGEGAKITKLYDEVIDAWYTPDAAERIKAVEERIKSDGGSVLGKVLFPSVTKCYQSSSKEVAALRELAVKLGDTAVKKGK